MRIAFVTPAYYPSIIGASFYCQGLVSYLTERGHEITVFTKWNTGWKLEDNIGNVEIKRIPVKHLFGRRFYYSSKMINAIASENFDIVHSHHYGYFPATAGLLAAKKLNVPHIFGPYFHPPIYGFSRWLQFVSYHLTQGLPLLRFSDKILPHTQYERMQLLKIGATLKNMEILPNIVDINIFKRNKNIKKEKLILFVSNFTKDKGADIAFNIVEKILNDDKDTKALFVGNSYDRHLLDSIKKLRKNKRIEFLRNINLSKLVELYNKASVVILPSRYEAFSRVLAESQSCGTPVVSTKVGGIPEVVMDKKTGFLVDYGKWDQMKEHINILLNDDSLNKKIGKYGSLHIQKKFNKQIVAQKLIRIYESVV